MKQFFYKYRMILGSLALLFAVSTTGVIYAAYSTGLVSGTQKISDTAGNFTETLDDSDNFSVGMDDIGDLDNDGISDMVVGAYTDDDGAANVGAVYILFMNADGTVKSSQKISDLAGGFTGTLDAGDQFGYAVAGIGDLDGDNIEDIAVSGRADDDGGINTGAIWILFLNIDGTVKASQKISDLAGGFLGVIEDTDLFGGCIDLIPDVNSDGIDDLIVCAQQDDDGGTNRGAVWILQMNIDGTVNGYKKISDTEGGFATTLDDGDKFGHSAAVVSDINHDGVDDIVVGAAEDDDSLADTGAAYILFMNENGTVASEVKISALTTNFADAMTSTAQFGADVASMGDLDRDGITDIVVGAWQDDEAAADTGAVFVIFLNSDGSVKRYQKITDGFGDFDVTLGAGAGFGLRLAALDDINGDGIKEIAVGSFLDDDGGTDRGAVYVMFLNVIRQTQTSTPANGGFIIDDGAVCTSSRNVSLLLSGNSIQDYLIGNDEFFLESEWKSLFSSTQNQAEWELTEGEGEKTVYVIFRSEDGNQSNMISHNIIYDLTCGQEADDSTGLPEEDVLPEFGISPVTGEMEEITIVSPGDVVQGVTLDTIYYIDGAWVRHPFLTMDIFYTYFDEIDEIVQVTDATIASFELGNPQDVKAGSAIVQFVDGKHIYLPTEAEVGLEWRQIEEDNVAESLFGINWRLGIMVMPTTFFPHVQFGHSIKTLSDILNQ